MTVYSVAAPPATIPDYLHYLTGMSAAIARAGRVETLPAAVVDCYRRFDHGEYPDLILMLNPWEPLL
jgi:hypothetical protein